MTSRNKGCTLIEYIVVVLIIFILVALAIPQFAAYRARGFNAYVEIDTRNAATAQEVYFFSEGKYYSGDCIGLPGFTPSDDRVICHTDATPTGFVIDVTHPNVSFSCRWNTPANSKGERMSCS